MKQLLAFILLLSAALQGGAVGTTSGNLETALASENPEQIVSLDLSGTMDARDFKFIAERMPNLETLDLSAVEITEYSGKEPLFGNFAYYEGGTLPKMCFAGNALKRIVLPVGLVKIGEGAFAGCPNLQSADIPGTVTEIGAYAFSGNPELAAVGGGEGLAAIGDYAFSHCRKLVSVPESDRLSEIGAYAFLDCGALETFAFPATLSALGEGAFKGTCMKSADMSGCGILKVIGAWAFADNAVLASVEFPGSVQSVGEGAFFYDSSLQKAVFPAGAAKINDFTFMGGKLITEASVPDGVTEIGAYAFSGWEEMPVISIPASVERIGERAFRNWMKLNTLTVDATAPPALGENVWEGVVKQNVELVIPEASEAAYRAAEQWKDFFNASSAGSVEDNGISVVSENGRVTLHSSETITSASLYDISGVLLSQKQGGTTVTFDLNPYGGQVYIIKCPLENGQVKYLKIGKK